MEESSPVKDKAPLALLHRRGCVGGRRAAALLLGFGLATRARVLLRVCFLLALLMATRQLGFRPLPRSLPSCSRGGYTVLINTWKRNTLLKRSVAHYASCGCTDEIHVVWSESDPPQDSLKAYLTNIVFSQSQSGKSYFRFELNEEDNLNNRFKPIKDLRNDAVFSVDDDVLVPCTELDFAFSVWQSASDTMVGFVPRMHWLDEKDGSVHYKYGGWWSVWWMGTYSMVLSKAAFFHRKYLDLYTYQMPSTIREYVTKERNCEDIAMSLLVANATGAPPIWVKGKIYEIASTGISSVMSHNEKRTKCLNDFIALYGSVPLVPTNLKVIDAQQGWLW